MECYLQAIALKPSIVDGASPRDLESIERFDKHSLESIAVAVLDVLASGGYTYYGRTIIEAERLLVCFPESLTLKAMGFDQNHCTKVKKDLQLIIDRALERAPIERIQTTALPESFLLFDRRSVVDEFLTARRNRGAATRR